jgi:hypothetical protein
MQPETVLVYAGELAAASVLDAASGGGLPPYDWCKVLHPRRRPSKGPPERAGAHNRSGERLTQKDILHKLATGQLASYNQHHMHRIRACGKGRVDQKHGVV